MRSAVPGDVAPGADRRVVAAAVAVPVVAALCGASAALNPFAPLALLAVVALLVVGWRRPVLASVVVCAVVPAVAGLGRGVGIPGLKLSELLLAGCAATLVLRVPARWRAMSGAEKALLLFAVCALGFGVHHAAAGTSDLESLLRVGLQPMFLYLAWWTASRGVDGERDVATVVRWTLLVSTGPSLLAIAQYFDLPGVRQTLIRLTGGDLLTASGDTFSRVTGPFPIWHSLGGYLILPTVITVVMLLRRDASVLRTRTLVVVLVLNATALVLSVTVTLLLWLPVAIVVAAVLAGRARRALLLLAVLGGVLFALFPGILLDRAQDQATAASGAGGGLVPQTLAYRFLVWQRDYFPLLEQGAVAGVGNDLPDTVFFTSTENQFITWALRGGIGLVVVGTLVIGALVVRSARHALAERRAGTTTGRGSTAMALVGIVGFLPATLMVWPYLTNAGLPATLFALSGAVLAGRPRGRPAVAVEPSRDVRVVT